MLDILPNSGDIAPLSPLLWRYSLVTRSGEPSSPRMPSQSVIGVFSDQFNDALPARVSRASSSASQSEIKSRVIGRVHHSAATGAVMAHIGDDDDHRDGVVPAVAVYAG